MTQTAVAPATQTVDPLAGAPKAPSAFGEGDQPGKVVKMVLEGPLTQTQQRDYDDSTKLLFWPDHTPENPKPKMVVVARGVVNGELRSLWAKKPSSLFRALQDAQRAAGGQPMEAGGILEVTYTGSKKNPEKPKLKPAKQFTAKYTPPTAGDALADDDFDGDFD